MGVEKRPAAFEAAGREGLACRLTRHAGELKDMLLVVYGFRASEAVKLNSMTSSSPTCAPA
jgi:hypothetical protein